MTMATGRANQSQADLLREALRRGLPGEAVITDPDVLASLSSDEAEWAPAGPAGLLWWLMSSAIGIFSFKAALYGLTGLWIHDPLPERMKRLLPASSQERTSGSIASL